MAKNNFSDAFGDLSAALDAAGDAVVVLPLTAVVEDPNNPRSSFDEAEVAALKQTIREKGVLQPITVRPPGPDGRHTIRFGARRFRAAQLAGEREIRALVQAGDDSEAAILLEQLIENDQREGLNTADLARAVDRLLDLKLSQSDIARRLGRPREQIVLLASIRKMPAELQAMAADLGLRTLFELNAAWRSNEERVRSWLDGRDAKTITQAEARSLAGRSDASTRTVRNPSDGSVAEIELKPDPAHQRASSRKPAPQGPTRSRSPVVEVQTSRGEGTLILDTISRTTQQVRVRLADGAIITTPALEVKILRLRPG